MNKRIALGVASALLGVTGVAGASVAVTGSSDVDTDSQSTGLSAVTDAASLNCVLAVGQTAADANCGASGAGAAGLADGAAAAAEGALTGLPGAGDVLAQVGDV